MSKKDDDILAKELEKTFDYSAKTRRIFQLNKDYIMKRIRKGVAPTRIAQDVLRFGKKK